MSNQHEAAAADDIRLPPQDLDAERSVLGSVLLSEHARDEVALIVSPEMFYADPHRRMYSAISDMHARGVRGIDPITLGHELQTRGYFEDVGGAPYIVQCLETVPHAGHAAYYAKIVRDKWRRRRLLESCTDTLRDVHSSMETDQLVERHDTATQGVLEDCVDAESTKSIGELLVEALSHVEDQSSVESVETGYANLDEKLGGLRGGNLLVIAARASVGKTAFALNLIRRIAESGRPVLLFSLEQGSLEISERLLAIQSGVSAYNLRRADVTADEMANIVEAQNALHQLPIFVDEQSEMRIQEISTKARLWKRRHGVKVIVIDYLQLIEPDDNRANREQQVARASKGLKRLARALDVPVIILAQLNREVEKREDKRPKLSDLRESGSVEQDADQVLFIHRPDYYDPEDNPGKVELHLAKNRHGPRAVGAECVQLYWEAATLRFYEHQTAEMVQKQIAYDWKTQ